MTEGDHLSVGDAPNDSSLRPISDRTIGPADESTVRRRAEGC